MSTEKKRNLSIKKLQITKFKNLKAIKGGDGSDTLVVSDWCVSSKCASQGENCSILGSEG